MYFAPSVPPCRRCPADHALDQLHVGEAPAGELLLVLDQLLGEQEVRRRPGPT
jgi:hypothetical protein